MDNIPGFLLALMMPVVFLGIIRRFDFYQTGQYRIILLSLVLGGIAYTPAALTNGFMIGPGHISKEIIERYIAPVQEEIFKGLFLFYLVRRYRLTYSVDGALYGFAVGTGFAVLENLSYISGDPSEVMVITIQRIFTTSLVHAFSSAAVGIALGRFHLETSKSKWQVPAVGLLIAIGQHMLYNNIIHLIDKPDSNEILLYITFVPGIPGIFFIRYVMQRGVKQARNWIKVKLGMEDRVTRSEVAAVDHLASPREVLFPVLERFGAETASQVEKLLYLQARLGIKRKSLDSIQSNHAIYNTVESEIKEMRTEIEKVQREIGAYAMLFVRGLFTEEMISVWDLMQTKIQERSAVTGGQKGGGLWSSLDERVKPSPKDERSEELYG